MNFNNLYQLLNEVDYRTVQSSDPSKERSLRGVDTANVVQYTDVDPATKRKKIPTDKGFRDERTVQSLIRNSVRLLKTDSKFRDNLNRLFEDYRSAIQQEADIDFESEKAMIYSVAAIQKLQSELTSLEEQRNAVERELERTDLSPSAREHYMTRLKGDPTAGSKMIAFMGRDEETGEMVKKTRKIANDPGILKKIESRESKLIKLKDKVEAAFDKATGDAIPINAKYIQPIINLITTTAKGLLDSMASAEPRAETTIRNLDELNPDDFSPEKLSEENVRIELLKMLASEDPQYNPVVRYLDMKTQAFDPEKVKDAAYRGGYNVNISKNLISNALPVSQLIRYYNFIKNDEPLKILSFKQKETKTKANTALSLLNIQSQEDFDAKKPDLVELIKSLNVDEHRKKAALQILKEPFLRRGVTAAVRLRGLLGGVIKELDANPAQDIAARDAFDESVNYFLSISLED